MKLEALKALKASIKHWDRMVHDNRLVDELPSSSDCPLCELFNKSANINRCSGCPVFDSTGRTLCGGTPYAEAFGAYRSFGISSPEFMKAAKLELKFLRSLLPKKRKKGQ